MLKVEIQSDPSRLDLASLLAQLESAIRPIADATLLPGNHDTTRQMKRDGSFVTACDHQMQQQIEPILRRLTPTVPVLGEEMEPSQQQALLHHAEALWVVDPLDGTTNFASGLPYFAVSIALLNRQGSLLGWVYDPVRQESFSAMAGGGSWLNGVRLQTPRWPLTLAQSMGLIDLKRLPKPLQLALVLQTPYASQRSYGSGALDWCWMAAGRCQIYLHGQQSLWDYAAGWLILQESGGLSATLSGEAVPRYSLEKRSIVAAGDEALFREWQGWVRSVLTGAA